MVVSSAPSCVRVCALKERDHMRDTARRHFGGALTWLVLQALLVHVTAADEDCPGGVCPVPENFASGAPPAPDFAITDEDEDEDDPLLQPSKDAVVHTPDPNKDQGSDASTADTKPGGGADASTSATAESAKPAEYAEAKAAADEECPGGVCPVPENFASGAPPASAEEATPKAEAEAETPQVEGSAEPKMAPASSSIGASKIGSSKLISKAEFEKRPTAAAVKAAREAADRDAAHGTASADAAEADSAQHASDATAAAATGSAVAASDEEEQEQAAVAVEEEEEGEFDLDTELGLMKVTAQMGSVGTTMDILINATFKLGDIAPRDGRMSKAEALAFSKAHLAPPEAKLGMALGLHGGHVPLTDASLSAGVDVVFTACDTTPCDGFVTRAEAKACRLKVHEMIVDINRRRLQAAAQGAAAAQGQASPGSGAAASGGTRDVDGAADAARQQAALQAKIDAEQQQARQQQQWQQQQGQQRQQSGTAGGTAGGAAAARRPASNPIEAEVGRRLASLQRTLKRNWEHPTLNTLVGGLGVVALLFREVLSADLMGARQAFRGLVGSNHVEFNDRLLHVALVAGALAAFTNLG